MARRLFLARSIKRRHSSKNIARHAAALARPWPASKHSHPPRIPATHPSHAPQPRIPATRPRTPTHPQVINHDGMALRQWPPTTASSECLQTPSPTPPYYRHPSALAQGMLGSRYGPMPTGSSATVACALICVARHTLCAHARPCIHSRA